MTLPLKRASDLRVGYAATTVAAGFRSMMTIMIQEHINHKWSQTRQQIDIRTDNAKKQIHIALWIRSEVSLRRKVKTGPESSKQDAGRERVPSLIMRQAMKGLQNPSVHIFPSENLVNLEYAKDIVLIFEKEQEAQALFKKLIKVIQFFAPIRCSQAAGAVRKEHFVEFSRLAYGERGQASGTSITDPVFPLDSGNAPKKSSSSMCCKRPAKLFFEVFGLYFDESTLLRVNYSDGRVTDEVNAGIPKARIDFANMRSLWRQRGVSLGLEGRVLQPTWSQYRQDSARRQTHRGTQHCLSFSNRSTKRFVTEAKHVSFQPSSCLTVINIIMEHSLHDEFGLQGLMGLKYADEIVVS
ncbi:hypothetical protein CLF_100126 [Clonorchis sinensis]|uniref:Reverse transcriptase domain-containing protein n=1 Tax=Clonorchis sinensis TaxID=79923 RepID=G7Y2Q8_CLOSI|nr:hypothetical protein CLF_100126 [Clonorchis sinensis]